jgi:uncharacterized protein DUF3108
MTSKSKRLACCTLAVLVLSAPAFAAGGEDVDRSGTPVSTLDLGLQLYVGGIPLGKAALSARVQGQDYKATSTLETLGIVSAFWKSKIETSANGAVAGPTVHPAFYNSFSQDRQSERRQVTLTFQPGAVKVDSNPPYPETRYKVPEDEQTKAVDPLSGAVMLIAAAAAGAKAPCTAVAPIFDGRRRYDVAVDFVKKIDIRMDNGLYSGPGMMCQFHYKQVAGYQQTVIEQGKKLPAIYVWVAPVKSTADPTREYMLPLRIWAETDYGIVVALANQASVDGKPVGAAAR